MLIIYVFNQAHNINYISAAAVAQTSTPWHYNFSPLHRLMLHLLGLLLHYIYLAHAFIQSDNTMQYLQQ